MFEAYITNTALYPMMGIEVEQRYISPRPHRRYRPPLPKSG